MKNHTEIKALIENKDFTAALVLWSTYSKEIRLSSLREIILSLDQELHSSFLKFLYDQNYLTTLLVLEAIDGQDEYLALINAFQPFYDRLLVKSLQNLRDTASALKLIILTSSDNPQYINKIVSLLEKKALLHKELYITVIDSVSNKDQSTAIIKALKPYLNRIIIEILESPVTNILESYNSIMTTIITMRDLENTIEQSTLIHTHFEKIKAFIKLHKVNVLTLKNLHPPFFEALDKEEQQRARIKEEKAASQVILLTEKEIEELVLSAPPKKQAEPKKTHKSSNKERKESESKETSSDTQDPLEPPFSIATESELVEFTEVSRKHKTRNKDMPKPDKKTSTAKEDDSSAHQEEAVIPIKKLEELVMPKEKPVEIIYFKHNFNLEELEAATRDLTFGSFGEQEELTRDIRPIEKPTYVNVLEGEITFGSFGSKQEEIITPQENAAAPIVKENTVVISSAPKTKKTKHKKLDYSESKSDLYYYEPPVQVQQNYVELNGKILLVTTTTNLITGMITQDYFDPSLSCYVVPPSGASMLQQSANSKASSGSNAKSSDTKTASTGDSSKANGEAKASLDNNSFNQETNKNKTSIFTDTRPTTVSLTLDQKPSLKAKKTEEQELYENSIKQIKECLKTKTIA